MNLLKIYYFIKIVESLNFKKAAEELYISRQALSKQIQMLEEEVGAQLLKRTTNHVAVTEVGKKMYDLYQPIFRDVDCAKKELEQFIQHKNNHLKLAYFNALSFDEFVGPFVDGWKSTYPDSTINIIAADAGIDREFLMNDRVDLLITSVTDFNEWDGMEILPFLSKEMKIIVSENHPWFHKESVTEQDIAEANMQVYNNRPVFGDKAYLPAIKPKERIIMYNSSSYMANLRQGNAFGVLSDIHLVWEGNFKLFRLPQGIRYFTNFSFVFKPLHPFADKIRKIGTLLQNQFQDSH